MVKPGNTIKVIPIIIKGDNIMKIISKISKIIKALSIVFIIAITVYPPVYNCTGVEVLENVIDDIRALSSGMYEPFLP